MVRGLGGWGYVEKKVEEILNFGEKIGERKKIMEIRSIIFLWSCALFFLKFL
jgi:hypothetical protein